MKPPSQKLIIVIKKQYLIVPAILLALSAVSVFCAQAQEYKSMRESMVRTQIRARGISHGPTIEAMRNVERHLFVPVMRRNRAYEDNPLPIGHGQTISQPFIVAYMTQLVNPGKDDRVLEIGTGSGYQAAILAEIVDRVYTMEIIAELGESAQKLLKDLNYDNVEVKIADGYYGWEEHAPFDAIVVTAAAEYIPPPLVDQLKDGGKMVIPVGSPFMVQNLMLVEKKGDRITTRSIMPVTFVPFTRKE